MCRLHQGRWDEAGDLAMHVLAELQRTAHVAHPRRSSCWAACAHGAATPASGARSTRHWPWRAHVRATDLHRPGARGPRRGRLARGRPRSAASTRRARPTTWRWQHRHGWYAGELALLAAARRRQPRHCPTCAAPPYALQAAGPLARSGRGLARRWAAPTRRHARSPTGDADACRDGARDLRAPGRAARRRVRCVSASQGAGVRGLARGPRAPTREQPVRPDHARAAGAATAVRRPAQRRDRQRACTARCAPSTTTWPRCSPSSASTRACAARSQAGCGAPGWPPQSGQAPGAK